MLAAKRMNRIGFVGAGNMARYLIDGLLKGGFSPKALGASGPSETKMSQLARETHIFTHTDNHEVVNWVKGGLLVLSVKPQKILAVVDSLKTQIIKEKPLLISVAAGLTTDWFRQRLENEVSLVRAMPNTPVCIQAGVTGLYTRSPLNAGDKESVEKIFSSVGTAMWVDEEAHLEVLTVLSGSGPAYFFQFMELLEEAAHSLGLPKEVAQQLTLQTALGAAKMAIETGKSLERLRREVTSPGGVTEAAVKVLMQEPLPLSSSIQAALAAGLKRNHELQQNYGGLKLCKPS